MSRKAHLTEAQRQQVRDWAKAGMKPRDIMEFLTNVTLPTIYAIIKEGQEYAPASVTAPSQTYTSGGLTFRYPPRLGSPFDFVVGAAEGAHEGWFPFADVSLVAGPSGSGKTTLVLNLLESQAEKKDFIGHSTFGYSTLVLQADRGEAAHARTLARTKTKSKIPFVHIPFVRGKAAVIEILRALENCPQPLPSVLFLEGADLLVQNASKMDSVMEFLQGLQTIARHYHLCIIASVGTSKVKPGTDYSASRDRIFGSVAWPRMTECVALLQYMEGDDADRRRILTVFPRNSHAEKFHLRMEQGQFVLDGSEDDVAEPADKILQTFKKLQDVWFSTQQYQDVNRFKPAKAYRFIKYAYEREFLKRRRNADDKHWTYARVGKLASPENEKVIIGAEKEN